MASAVVAAGMKRKSPESSSSSSSGINYEVFLSFRGEDTRKTITDHLYSRLADAGIKVFRDDEELRAGEEIHPRLKEAIRQSTISIAIFSKDYASSKSCLMEVVQMWECRELNGQTVIPIFYDICPFDVKRQAGDFGRSFDQHVRDGVNADTIQRWKDVFRKIGGLSGFNRADIDGGRESQLVEKVLRRVWQVLKKDDRVITEKLVGIDLHVQEMMRLLGVVYSNGKAIRVCGKDVRVIGICGMRGVGKTTLAKVVYNKIHMMFDGCGFLEGINSSSVKVSQEILIASLQKRKLEPLNSFDDGIKKMEILFSNMKVLIVLDNAHEVEQIKGLAEKLVWFGPGSRIIVTTYARNVLNIFNFGEDEDRAVEEYVVEPMRHHHALQLFRKHAFQGNAPKNVYEYDSLSIDIVKAIRGVPLAIELRASYLRHKNNNIEIWRETLDLLKEDQGEQVESAFKDSYQSLDIHTREIFLDIACFFIGKDERIPSYMWKACSYYPSTGIEKLRDMHLLEDGENKELRMHNLLRDFGRKLVQEKALRERCRIWDHSDAVKILKYCLGTESVEGIGLTVEEGSTVCFTYDESHQMSKLRYLRLDRAKIQGNTENLLPNLRWLDWRECHSIPELCNMHLEELVILDLSRSPVPKNSQIWSRFKEEKKLKVLNLQGCGLVASLKFPAPINLEILILEDCTRLSEIGTFISQLGCLKSLNLRNCKGVKQLPQQLHRMKFLTELLIDGTDIKGIHIPNESLEKLEKLSACGCIKLKDISPIGHLTNLKSLALDDAINWHPETFEFPQNLWRLSLRNCSMFKELPPSIGKLRLLEVIDLSDTKITVLPESVKDLRNLKTLKMERTHLQNFPEDIVNLKKLEEIDFSGCKSLVAQDSCDISGLSSLRILKLSSSNVAGLPRGICGLSRLRTLDVSKCKRLQTLPELPSSLLTLCWGSKIMRAPQLRNLTNLKELCLNNDERPEAGSSNPTPDIGWILGLTSLETFELSLPNVASLPGDFRALSQLRELTLSYMKELVLTQLRLSRSLWTLRLKHCNIQKSNFTGLKYLSELELEDCDLAEIDGLKDLTLLEVLKISQCNGIRDLNELKGLPRLRKVQVFPFDSASLSELRDRGCEVDTCR